MNRCAYLIRFSYFLRVSTMHFVVLHYCKYELHNLSILFVCLWTHSRTLEHVFKNLEALFNLILGIKPLVWSLTSLPI